MKWEWPSMLVGLAFLSVAYCAPPYVWGDEDQIEKQLLRMVPLGSSPEELQAAAKRPGWEIELLNVYRSEPDRESYMDDHDRDCRTRGGLVAPIIIARFYAPFETVVETQWMFDERSGLRDICVRSTVDAL